MIKTFISEKRIQSKVTELALDINEYYKSLRDNDGSCDKSLREPIIVLSILKGSFVFCADLIRQLDMPLSVEFMSISSYGNGTKSGKVNIEMDVRRSIEGKRVLLVEDIIDTGNSLSFLLETLLKRNPKSLDIVTLLSKPHRQEIPVRFPGIIIPDEFVVGYGLDYDEKYRQLPYIGILN
jgi:hypoxanthine phosphoribosyltransferase